MGNLTTYLTHYAETNSAKMAYLPLLQTLQQAANFNQTDERHLAGIQKLLVAEQSTVSDFLTQYLAFSAVLEENRQIMQRVFAAWAHNAFLTPCDELYAQRRWLMGLVGLKAGVPPQDLAAKLESFYRFVAGQLLKESVTAYKATLLKSLNVDLAFIGQCYTRNQPIAVNGAIVSTDKLNQAFAAKPGTFWKQIA